MRRVHQHEGSAIVIRREFHRGRCELVLDAEVVIAGTEPSDSASAASAGKQGRDSTMLASLGCQEKEDQQGLRTAGGEMNEFRGNTIKLRNCPAQFFAAAGMRVAQGRIEKAFRHATLERQKVAERPDWAGGWPRDQIQSLALR